MLKTHLELLQKTISDYNLIPQNAKILVAISGGPDSVYLAFLLYTLGFEISLAHVNYGLRNLDSQNDEAKVQAYAKLWKVPIYIHRENPKSRMLDSGQSLQQIARKIRYDFFERLIQEHKYDKCALAHHADDQVESILLSLIKGNGDRVLHGIPIQRGPFVRPLIRFSKEEILKGLEAQNLSFGHDISNDGNEYTRNKIRNQVLPLIEKINPSIKRQLLFKEDLYRKQKHVLDEELEEICKSGVKHFEDGSKSFSWNRLNPAPSREKLKQILIFVLNKWMWHGNDLWNAVALLDSESGKRVEGAAGTIYREREGIYVKPKGISAQKAEELRISASSLPATFEINGWAIQVSISDSANFDDPHTYYLDANKLSFPLLLRSIMTGDKMQPLGMKNQKKLSDIMIDGKWSQREKESGTVLTDGKQILALLDFRVSECVKVSAESSRLLKVKFGRIEHN